MEKVDISKMDLKDLKVLYFDQQQELADVRNGLNAIMAQIQKKSSVGAKVKKVLSQLPKGKKK